MEHKTQVGVTVPYLILRDGMRYLVNQTCTADTMLGVYSFNFREKGLRADKMSADFVYNMAKSMATETEINTFDHAKYVTLCGILLLHLKKKYGAAHIIKWVAASKKYNDDTYDTFCVPFNTHFKGMKFDSIFQDMEHEHFLLYTKQKSVIHLTKWTTSQLTPKLWAYYIFQLVIIIIISVYNIKISMISARMVDSYDKNTLIDEFTDVLRLKAATIVLEYAKLLATVIFHVTYESHIGRNAMAIVLSMSNTARSRIRPAEVIKVVNMDLPVCKTVFSIPAQLCSAITTVVVAFTTVAYDGLPYEVLPLLNMKPFISLMIMYAAQDYISRMARKNNALVTEMSNMRLELVEASDTISQSGLHGVFYGRYCSIEIIKIFHTLKFMAARAKLSFLETTILAPDIFRAFITWFCMYYYVSEGKMTVGDKIALVMLGEILGQTFVQLAQIYPNLKIQVTHVCNAYNLFNSDIDNRFLPSSERAKHPAFHMRWEHACLHYCPMHKQQPNGDEDTTRKEFVLDTSMAVLQFDSCTLGYPGKSKAVSTFCYEARDKYTSIVGRSGCGKSTVLKAATGLISPVQGVVLHHGCNIQDLVPQWQQNIVSVITQDPHLYNASVLDNISNFDAALPEEVLLDAAKTAEIYDDIMKLPHGPQTMCGRQMGLSGGQKQRIVIARTIAKRAKIMLLDEATSALDVHSKTKVEHALKRAGEQRCVIEVTHNIHAASTSDCIVVMHQGMLVESGCHDELLSIENGIYSKMWAVAQSFSAGPLMQATPDMLRSCFVFQQLSVDLLETLCAESKIESYKSDATIVVQGETASGLYIVVSGSVDVKTYNVSKGEHRKVAVLERGDYFGEMALLQSTGGNKRLATVQASSDVRLIFVSYASYNAHVHSTSVGKRISEIAEKRKSGLAEISEYVSVNSIL